MCICIYVCMRIRMCVCTPSRSTHLIMSATPITTNHSQLPSLVPEGGGVELALESMCALAMNGHTL